MEDGTCTVEVWVHSGYWREGGIFSFYKKYTVQTWHPLFTQDGGWMAVVGSSFPGVATNSPLMQICLKFLQKSWNPLFSAPHPQSNKQTEKKRPQLPNTASFTGWGRVSPAVLQGFAHWTGPAKPCAHGSMQPAIVRFSKHVEVGFHVMRGDRLLVQRVGGLEGTEKHKIRNLFS